MQAFVVALLVAVLPTVRAQQQTFELDASGAWASGSAEVGDDERTMLEASTLIAQGSGSRAASLLQRWIDRNRLGEGRWLATAHRLRGDALVAQGNEYKALFEYEVVARQFPGSEEFVTSMRRQFDIGVRYLDGMRRKWLGLRILSAKSEGEELMYRIAERLPGSGLAEEAMLELGDYYYRKRDLEMAREAYRVFLVLYPRSSSRQLAMQRQVISNQASFKGPAYDTSPLVEAKALIDRYRELYPADAEAAGLNEAQSARVQEDLASERLYRARWYLKQGDEPAARLVLRRLVRAHPGTSAQAEALKILADKGWTVGQAQSSQPEQDEAAPDEPSTPTTAPAPGVPRTADPTGARP